MMYIYIQLDFAGPWGYYNDGPKSVESHTGYFILLGNLPVLWTFKHYSTKEAEYIALNITMRAFILRKHVLIELVAVYH